MTVERSIPPHNANAYSFVLNPGTVYRLKKKDVVGDNNANFRNANTDPKPGIDYLDREYVKWFSSGNALGTHLFIWRKDKRKFFETFTPQQLADYDLKEMRE